MPSLNLDLNYFDNPKTLRLVARLGPGADIYPIRLWVYIGKHHPESGSISMLEQEIEHICKWQGEQGILVKTFVELGFLRKDGDSYDIKDWFEHSGHLAAMKKRGRDNAMKRWHGISPKDAGSNAASIAGSNASGNALAVLTKLTKLTTTAGASRKQNSRFLIPTPQEVAEYAKTISFELEGQMFCDYYEARGWKIGNNPMKSWKAAVRIWKQKRREAPGKPDKPIDFV